MTEALSCQSVQVTICATNCSLVCGPTTVNLHMRQRLIQKCLCLSSSASVTEVNGTSGAVQGGARQLVRTLGKSPVAKGRRRRCPNIPDRADTGLPCKTP